MNRIQDGEMSNANNKKKNFLNVGERAGMISALCLLLISITAVHSTRLVVDKNGEYCVTGDGIHTTIQSAVDYAYHDDEIYICEGVYNENVTVYQNELTITGEDPGSVPPKVTINVGGSGHAISVSTGGDYHESFTLNGVKIVGGTDGLKIGENVKNVTVKNCEFVDSDIELNTASDLVHLHVKKSIFRDASEPVLECQLSLGPDAKITIDETQFYNNQKILSFKDPESPSQVEIINNSKIYNNTSTSGALIKVAGKFTINNSKIYGNTVNDLIGNLTGEDAGGINIKNGTVISDNEFSWDLIRNGPGEGLSISENVVIKGNHPPKEGENHHLIYSDGDIDIWDNVQIANNTANNSIIVCLHDFENTEEINIYNNVYIYGNTAGAHLINMDIWAVVPTEFAETNLENRVFIYGNNLGGYVLSCDRNNLSVSQTEISDNKVEFVIYSQFSPENLIKNSLFTNNEINGYGDLYRVLQPENESALTIRNCTFYNNYPVEDHTAPLYLFYAGWNNQISITNTIAYHDEHAMFDEVIWSGGDGQVTASHSIIKGGPIGDGNRDTDPMVVKSWPMGYHKLDFSLKKNSPAVNEGDNYAGARDDDDLAGNDRIYDFDGNPHTPDAIDIGAYELQEKVGSMIAMNHIGKGFLSPEDNGKIHVVNKGEDVELFISPAEGSRLVKLVLSDISEGTQIVKNPEDLVSIAGGDYIWSFTAQNDQYDVIAEFEIIPFTITTTFAKGQDKGSVRPGEVTTALSGDDKLLYFIPDAGYRVGVFIIDKGTDDEVKFSDGRQHHIFKNIQKDHTVEVAFTPCDIGFDVEPNYVKTKSYFGDGSKYIVSYTVPDGFGRTIQTQTHINDGSNTNLVTGKYLDKMGRASITPLTFPYNAVNPETGEVDPQIKFQFINMGCKELVRLANEHYDGDDDDYERDEGETPVTIPDAENFAFSEILYYPNPMGAKYSTGSPGLLHSLAEDHYPMSWTFTVENESSFLTASELNVAALNKKYNKEIKSEGIGNKWVLSVFKDSDGKFTQQIKDLFGSKVINWSNPVLSDDQKSIKSTVLKNELAGYIITTMPDETQQMTKFVDNLGRVVESGHPDKGLLEFRYDSKGRLRFSKNAMQRHFDTHDDPATEEDETLIDHFTIHNYDAEGRLVSVGLNNDPDADFDKPDDEISGIIKKEFIYDDISETKIRSLIQNQKVAAAVFADKSNTYTKKVAEIQYSEDGDVIADISYFYPNGQLKSFYKIVPSLPVQKFKYEYTADGELAKGLYYNGFDEGDWSLASVKSIERDKFDMLSSISEGSSEAGKIFVKYIHNTKGGLIKKVFSNKQESDVESMTFQEGIEGLREISSKGDTPNFKQTITYNASTGKGQPKYNGLIQSSTFNFDDQGTQVEEEFRYAYDDVHRLKVVDKFTDLPSPNNEVLEYGKYQYDEMGRITEKKEDGRNLGDYDYYPANNQLRNVGDREKYNQYGNYVYNLNGNMVLDRSKNMVIDYDWNGNAISFGFYESIPSGALTWIDVYRNKLEEENGIERNAHVKMVYDASGARVLKRQEKKVEQNQQEVTLYKVTGYLGNTAVFNNTDELDAESMALKYVNYTTPGGVTGKREIENGNEFFYLKDHQGSVRWALNGTSNQTQEVNVFKPYGELDNRYLNGNENVKELFTGKELDSDGYNSENRMDLYYFGARYFDSELGIWLTPDPKEQFFNSYSYTGGNPINLVDPNGEVAFLAFVAMAAVTNLAVQAAHGNIDSWGDAGFALAIGAVQGVIGGLSMGVGNVGAMKASTLFLNSGLSVVNSFLPSAKMGPLSLSPSVMSGTHGLRVGGNVGLDMPLGNRVTLHLGVSTHYSNKSFLSSKTGWSGVQTAGISGRFGDDTYVSFYLNNYNGADGDVKQRTWRAGLSRPKWGFSHENDMKVGWDNNRTAAGEFYYKVNKDLTVTANFTLYTPEHSKEVVNCPDCGWSKKAYNPFRYKKGQPFAGVLAAGIRYKGVETQFGRDNESVRNLFQNVVVHNLWRAPWHKKTNRPERGYYMVRASTDHYLY